MFYKNFPPNLLSRIVASEIVSEYPVDESQSVCNAGDAVVYNYWGRRYEVITWNERAMEHNAGEISVSNLAFKD